MAMDNEWYKDVWGAVDFLYSKRYPGHTIKGMDAMLLLPFVDDMKSRLDEFAREIIARTKACDAKQEEAIRHHRCNLAAKGYQDITPHDLPLEPF